MRTPTIAQLRNGPPSVDLQTAAAVLGLGRTKAYEMARSGEFPVRILRIGGSYRVPTAALLELLGISETSTAPAEARAGLPATTRPH